MRRRPLIRSLVAIGTVSIAGCTGGEDDDGIVIEYSISDPKTHEEVPEEVIDHPNPEGFHWVVVDFQLVSGSFDAADIMGLTQIRIGGTDHFTRAVMITSPDEELLTSEQDSYEMEEGAQGDAYYRFEEESDDIEWVVEQLANQHGDIEVGYR